MVHALARNWLALVLRGVAAVIFGILAFLMPGITLIVLVTLFAIYALFDGVINLIGAFRAGIKGHWPLVFEGIVGIVAGILALVWPHITILVFVYVIGFWAIVTGVLEIVAAVRLWRVLGSEWLLLISGIISLIFGFVVLAVPLAGAFAIVVWIAAYALIFGFLLIGFGIRLRAHARKHLEPPQQPLAV